jgi:hypothetical protein
MRLLDPKRSSSPSSTYTSHVELVSEASVLMTMPVTATEVRVVLARIDQRRSLRGPGEGALTPW